MKFYNQKSSGPRHPTPTAVRSPRIQSQPGIDALFSLFGDPVAVGIVIAALLLPPPLLPGIMIVVVAAAYGALRVHVDMLTPLGPIVKVWPPMTVVTAVEAPAPRPMWNVLPPISTAVKPIWVIVAPPTISYLVALGAAVTPPKTAPCTMTPVGAISTVSPSTTVVIVLLEPCP